VVKGNEANEAEETVKSPDEEADFEPVADPEGGGE